MLQPLFFRSTSSRFPTPCRRSFSSGPPSFRRRQVLEIESRWTDGTFSGHYDTLLQSHGSFHPRGARVPSTLGKRNILSQTVNLGLIHAAGSSSIQAHHGALSHHPRSTDRRGGCFRPGRGYTIRIQAAQCQARGDRGRGAIRGQVCVVDPLLPHSAERGFPNRRIARCSCVIHVSWLFPRAD